MKNFIVGAILLTLLSIGLVFLSIRNVYSKPPTRVQITTLCLKGVTYYVTSIGGMSPTLKYNGTVVHCQNGGRGKPKTVDFTL
ncbi:MAG: hypothetical protein ACE5EE_10860 [Fidelibacterota bacterium]